MTCAASLGVSATDPTVIATATQQSRAVLTTAQSEFSAPPTGDHSGIMIIADVTWAGEQV